MNKTVFYTLFVFCILLQGEVNIVWGQSHNTNFKTGDNGWIGAYTGYPANAEKTYELNVSWAKTPAHDDEPDGFGLIFAGKNYSGQVFLYAYKYFSGLRPNSSYKIIANTSILTNYYPIDDKKIYLKIGALNKPPTTYELRMVESNIHKGDFGQSGKNMMPLGLIQASKNTEEYENILLYNYQNPFITNTNKNGELWIIIGIEADEEIRDLPNTYLKTLRLIFHNNGEYKTPSIAATRMNLYPSPDKQNIYFESEFDNEIDVLCIYTEEGHLVKVISFKDQFIDHTINTSDLLPGHYFLNFILQDGRSIKREITVE
ncbi:MAG: T9SS type A sorting domain-containing protein [Bacteroidales bacterium]